jgi:hypothetical protein
MRNFWYDIKAFMLLRKEVKRQKKTVEWQKFGLRHDWLYRIYTVVNPTDQDKGDDEQMIQMKAFDKCTPMTKYIMSFGTTPTNSIGLSEVLTLSMEKIPETDSYLVVYYQIYYWFNPWRFWSRLILLLTAATLAIVYFF